MRLRKHQTKLLEMRFQKKKYKAKPGYFRNFLTYAKDSGDKSATWDVINGVIGKKSEVEFTLIKFLLVTIQKHLPKNN